MQERIVMSSEKHCIPYKGGPRHGKQCRPRQRADGVWAIDAIMPDKQGHLSAIPRGHYEYQATPEPHMKWIANPDHLKVAKKAAECRSAHTVVVDTANPVPSSNTPIFHDRKPGPELQSPAME